jgi:hypothetical protein
LVPSYDRILHFLGYRPSERQDDYVEWEGPCGWFSLRPARTGSKDRLHDRYEPGPHHLAFSAESREQVDEFHQDILLSLRATVLDPPGSGRNIAKATTLSVHCRGRRDCGHRRHDNPNAPPSD